MLDLSPTKLLVVFVVVVVLLGPKRLPQVAHQLGAGWRKLRDLHGRLDRELRETVPDLPSSQEIVRFARSPITLLNRLAERTGDPGPARVIDAAAVDADPSRRGEPPGTEDGGRPSAGVLRPAGLDADDPNLN